MKDSVAVVERHDWSLEDIAAYLDLPFNELLYRAHEMHRACFDPNAVQMSILLSMKTGTCPEDCGYCSQSGHVKTGIQKQKLMSKEAIVAAAKQAKANGATRFCMSAAWRGPNDKDLATVAEAIKAVKALGLETCATMGMLKEGQAEQLKEAGLDYYNHNIDTSRAHYSRVITSHSFDDRLQTLARVREAGLHTCCGGIMGMGETRADRASFLQELANLPTHPKSVTLNRLIPIAGTPLEDAPPLDPFEFVRVVAVARILMPRSYVRLSAGRNTMSEELQALCFFAGANSIHTGDSLLTTPLQGQSKDEELLTKLGIKPLIPEHYEAAEARQ